jgi:hypothetical protein
MNVRIGRRRNTGLNLTSAVGGIALLGVAYLFVRALPEIIRYARISRM